MAPASDSALGEKLDLLISIQRLAHRSALEQERAEILADPVSKAVLTRARDWTDAGSLQAGVAGSAEASTSTVKRRIAELVERGLIKRDGSGPNVRYRSTGLIEL